LPHDNLVRGIAYSNNEKASYTTMQGIDRQDKKHGIYNENKKYPFHRDTSFSVRKTKTDTLTEHPAWTVGNLLYITYRNNCKKKAGPNENPAFYLDCVLMSLFSGSFL
jgi:hypothetical protein